ncbi:type VI secretion system membrane subunit TssM [Jannaschia sp. Os4]|uniref:type VI secretion system membrane subunit TssM n=1 Tax=Jannaschia sp. Os4 TaxID=2807617 RepID=UPI001939B7D7|nr:type VI secretion system membrane subunit TssM [Jannaschia sp. Os4]MBM2578075.1 type VI secretion system membrane subunit TssM [Jannaschia sp. Os4]
MMRRLFRKLFKHGWFRTVLMVLGLIGLCVAVWIGFPMTGVVVMGTVWLRATVIGTILGIVFTVWLVRFLKRRRAARELEEAMVPVEPVGDGKVLAERMTEALATLKKAGGRTYLYDLPWYVIIGPPGAGKTTALKNSGIEFPLDRTGGALEGFGGTRNCDWWFAEDAVLIDTAGRYTTQDSHAEADGASWRAFLDLLKRTRPSQPINGVILALSIEDVMGDDVARHAETVRARLAEIHETLKVDFPVYVLFTKADLVAGFREYFGSFSLQRRNAVWGTTFQTKDRKALTHEAVPAEFDRLVGRLSEEVIDRLNEEPDGISRIAIFGLPGQMAMLREGVSDFLRRVFEPTRYTSNAILRGFYFASGTQEGTPIDQVLGAIDDGAAGFGTGFMSGKGKSFFLRDLLEKVIFAERDWVSHDRRAVRRQAVARGVGFTAVTVLAAAALAGMGWSYWRNASLVDVARAEAASYARQASEEIDRQIIDDTRLEPILPILDDLRAMPAGYGTDADSPVWEGLGLGQRDRLEDASEVAYSDALERMLRPRLILSLEQEMPLIVGRGDTTEIYRALKVYMLLGAQGGRTDDGAILSWFEDTWRAIYDGLAGLDTREALMRHLGAMLELDDVRDPLVEIDEATIALARGAITRLTPADQAWALIEDGVASAGLPDWSLETAAGGGSDRVFSTRDGTDLSRLTVPALYTYEGFWAYFYPSLDEVAERLRADQWVLGEDAASEEFEARMGTLDRTLLDRYRRGHKAAWDAVLGNLSLNSLVADAPRYETLGLLASEISSPLLMLVRAVDTETQVTRELEGLEGLTPDALAGGVDAEGIAGNVGSQVLQRVRSRSTGVQRILMEAATSGGGGGRIGVAGASGGGGDGLVTPIERIAEEYEDWSVLLSGEPGKRPIDAVLGNLGSVWTALAAGRSSPEQTAVLLPQILSELTRYNSQLPTEVAALVNEAEADFRQGATDANIETMNRALANQITFFCRDTIAPSYPFSDSSRALSIDNFARFFGPNGDMDRFYTEFLAPHAERTSEGLRWREDGPLAGRLSPGALRQFDRAERIRQAFFAGGGTKPEVEISVQQVDNHVTVESAVLIVNDQRVPTVRYEIPKTVVWPGTGSATAIQLLPDLGRPSTVGFTGSAWTFMQLLDAATGKTRNGDTTRATFTIGGRNITYDFTINAIANPFTMPELREFECPQSLD